MLPSRLALAAALLLLPLATALPGAAPTAPQFSTAHALTGFGHQVAKIIASQVSSGTNASGLTVDKRTPVSFTDTGTRDIAIADGQNNTVTIKRGPIGTSGLADVVLTVPDGTITDMVVADLNKDGLPDIVVCVGGSLQVYLNTYDSSATSNPSHLLTFADPVAYGAPDPQNAGGLINLGSVAAIQVDLPESTAASTTAPDLVAGGASGFVSDPTYTGYVVRFHNQQDGTFTSTVDTFALNDGAQLLAVGDLDNDGYTDIVVADEFTGKVNVILNQSVTGGTRTIDPSISTPNELFTSAFIAGLTIGDFDNDGYRDILVLNGYSSNSGAPTFSSRLTFFQNQHVFTNHGANAFANAHSNGLGIKTVSSNMMLTGVVGNIAIGDLNGDGTTGEIAVADGLDDRIALITVDPANVALNHGNVAATPTFVTAGPEARYVALGDLDGDGGLDLVVANTDDTTPGDYLINAVGGAVSDILPGRGLAFGQITVTGGEGGTVDVKVLRGQQSTGQVLGFFTEGGTAVQNFGRTVGADYTITDPGIAQPVTFGATEFVKHIKISVAKSPGAEPTKTIVLTLLDPVGDAELDPANDQISVTIALVDGKPSVIAKPTFLVLPTSIAPQTPNALRQLGVKAQLRDNAAVTFVAVEAFAAGTLHPVLEVQQSTNPLDETSWSDVIALTYIKGAIWAAQKFTFPIVPKLYFRIKATADGYPDLYSAPIGAYRIVPGPSLALDAAQSSSVAGPFIGGDIPIAAAGDLYYRLSYTAESGPTADSATKSYIVFPLPPHTTFADATSISGVAPSTLKSGARVTYVYYNLGTINPGATASGIIHLKVDPTTAFSRTDPLKALGQVITAKGYYFVANEVAKTPFGSHPTLDAEIKGPIDLSVTASASSDPVGGGDVISYDLIASNTSSSPLSGGVVYDRIPLGTQLETLYLPDANGNSDLSQPFTAPTASSNPTVVYVIVQLPKLFTLTKANGRPFVKGDEIDIPSFLNAGTIDQSFLQFLIGTGAIAQEVRWTLPTIPGASHVELRYQVQVLYDATSVLVNSKNLRSITNDDFDFTIPSGTAKISALYGHKPDASTGSLTMRLQDNESVDQIDLGLSKSFSGDSILTDRRLTGSGYDEDPAVGGVVNGAQDKGFDVILSYSNGGHSLDAHHCIIHDVIPPGAVLTGYFSQGDGQGNFAAPAREQFVFYDKNSVPITTFDGAGQYLLNVRSMDFTISPGHTFGPGASGSLSYTLQPNIAAGTVLSYPHHPEIPKTPTVLYFFNDRDPTLKLSDPEQGTYMTTSDMQETVSVYPAAAPVRIVPPISFATSYTRSTNQRQGPGSVYHNDFLITSNSDYTADAAHLDLVLPKGVQLAPVPSPNPQGITPPKFIDTKGGSPTVAQSGATTSLVLGSFSPHETRAVRVYLQIVNVNGAVDPALAKLHYADYVTAPVVRPGGVTAARALRFAAAALKPADEAAAGYARIRQPVPVGDPTGPQFSLYRGQPYTVEQGGSYTYTIAFANLGQKAATNVVVEMQVPYGVTFDSTDAGFSQSIVNGQPVPVANPRQPTMTQRTNRTVIAGSGGGVDIVTWHFDSIAPQAVGTLKLHVRAFPLIRDATVADHSLDIYADGVAKLSIANSSVGTRILGKPFRSAGWEILGGFLEHFGFPINQATQPPLATFVDQLSADSRITATAAMDGLLLNNGVAIYPLGNNQAMVVGVENASGQVSNGTKANRLVSGDGHSVTAGLASSINVSGISQTYDALAVDQLLVKAQDIANAHLGRIIPAGGNNLVSVDDANNAVQVSNDPTGSATNITGSATGVIDAGANGKLVTSEATIVKSGLVSEDGTGLITQDGGGLITQDGGGLITQDGGGLTSTSTGNVVNGTGSGLVSSNGSK